MKKIIFFPYHPDIRTIIDFKNDLVNYEISGVISYKEDQHLIEPLNRAIGVYIDDCDELISACDAIILLDNYRDYHFEKYLQVIDSARKKNKQVIITPLALIQLRQKYNIENFLVLEKYPKDYLSSSEVNTASVRTSLRRNSIPIIAILGMGINCDKFYVQLLTNQALRQRYKIASINSNALGTLFDNYTLPSFLYDSMQFQEKIFRFNEYFDFVARESNADAIIIGIPEGIAPFDVQEFHHFAEYPLIISKAVFIDIAIFCSYLLNGSEFEIGLKDIIEKSQIKFEVPIAAYAMSRTIFEIPNDENEKIAFDHLEGNYLERTYPSLAFSAYPALNLLNLESAKEIILECIQKLANNVEAM